MDIDPQYWVRILLFEDTKVLKLKIDSPFAISESRFSTNPIRFKQNREPMTIRTSKGKIVIDGRGFEEQQLIVSPDTPHIFNLQGCAYRGKLKLIINPENNTLSAINLIPPESYLAGVIAAEMPAYWEPQALKTQAIAARTYCFYIKNNFGGKRSWDLKATAANQVYRGINAESPLIWSVINETTGQVLTCKNTDGTQNIFPSYYSSTCGGHTENSVYVFGGDFFKPLAGVSCPHCQKVAKPSFFFWPMVKFDKSKVTANLLKRYHYLKELGQIKDIVPTKQNEYKGFSRLLTVKLVGTTGKSVYLRAEDLRITIDPTGSKLRSTICKIVNMGDKWAFIMGRGYGHGVGMCQYGVQGMARKGKTYSQILSFYFPGSKITRIY